MNRPGMREYDFPAPAAVLSAMRVRGHSLASLACLDAEQAIKQLRTQWNFPPHFFHLRTLAHAILQRGLLCLSVYEDEYWLTFNSGDDDLPLSIAGWNELPALLMEQFPVTSVDGLEAFLHHFGGTAEWLPPSGGCFDRPADYVLVSSNDERYDWGVIGGWEGALRFYQGAAGDCIVIHPKGYVGIWSHDIGWERTDEVAFKQLSLSFVELIEHYSQYLALPLLSPEREQSPFFY
jgi:hypothetical protein